MRSTDTRRLSPLDFARAIIVYTTWLFILLLAGWSSQVQAHASLIASSPDARTVENRFPQQIVLRFNEPVTPLAMRLMDPQGAIVPVASATAVGDAVHVEPSAAQTRGTYALSWRVVSADGHPVGGTLTFSVGSPSADQSPDANANAWRADTAVRATLIWLTRLWIYLGICLGIAGAIYTAHTAVGIRPWAAALIGSSAVALLASLPLLGLDALDRTWPAVFDPAVWRAALATSYTRTALLLMLAFFSGVAAWRTPGPQKRCALAAGALAMAAAGLAASGHAASAPGWLSRPVVWLHVCAVALWLGVFWPLLHELKTPPRVSVALPRFTRLAPAIITVLLLSGLALAWLQLDSWTAIGRTAYGRILAAKLVLVLMLLALGAWNRYRLTAAVQHNAPSARRRMRRIVAVELLFAIVILALVAGWRFTPPPRALHAHATAAAPVRGDLIIRADSATADVSWTASPGVAPESFIVKLSTPEGAPLRAQEVQMVFFHPLAGIEPIVFTATPTADDAWRVDHASVPPLPGWRLRIDALVSDFDRITLETSWLDTP